MFGKMMNSFYYGKSGKGDYRKEDLPKNRRQLFFEMLRVRLSGLIRLNLMYAVAWIPVIILVFLTIMAAVGLLDGVVTESEGLLAEGEGLWDAFAKAEMQDSLLAFMDQINNLILTGLLFLVPCLFITGPFTAGIAYITRNWARDEHAFIWSDFKDTVKSNWKQALLTSLITGIMPVIVYIGYRTYGEMAVQSGFLYTILQVFIVVVGVIWSFMTIYIYPLMVTYKLSYKQLIRNAALLAIGRLPQSLLMRLLSLLPLAVAVAVVYFTGSLEIVIFVTVLLYLLFFFAFNRFVYASYANGVFDKYINARIEGVQVNRGLSTEEDEDEDEEEEQEA